MFFLLLVLFWNKSKIYFFISSLQNIKSNYQTIFFKFLPIISFWWLIYSFPIVFIKKSISFVILCGSFFISSWFNAIVTAYWKHFYLLYWLDLLLLFCLFIQSGDLVLFYDVCNTINENKIENHHLLLMLPIQFDT